jgi:predicted membrane-bound spermidine synthase
MIGAAHLLSFLMGFLSLSQEILWVRMASFSYGGAPQAFGLILAIYLLGIALGANWGKRYCARGGKLYFVAAGVLLLAAVLDMVMPWLVVFSFGASKARGTNVMMACVLLTAALKSIVFPIAHHLGSSAKAGLVGASVSRVYFANIAGATLGPLVTGFVILQYCTLQQSFALMAGATLVSAAYCWLAGGGRLALTALAGSTALAAAFLIAVPPLMLSTLINNRSAGPYSFKEAVENRYGIIHLMHDEKGPDIVFGGNAYDGRINTDYMEDSNFISRVYMLAAVKPQPKRVLVLGMSAGSWTRVLQSFPGVEHIDVLEINPGYVDIIREYEAVRPILQDPRIAMHFDDGRRWLKRHSQERYDLVVMNTTFHYRAYITLLLSQDFLRQMRQHMLPGAVLAFNSTGSEDAYKTATSVFGEVYRLQNFVVAGDALTLPEEAEIIRRMGGLIDVSQADVLEKVHKDLQHFTRFDEAQAARAAGRPLEIITDQNMLTEYKYGAPLLYTLGWVK